MKTKYSLIGITVYVLILTGCQEPEASAVSMSFRFKFDPAQARLNNFGLETPMASGHAGQTPIFNKISAHYIELAPTALTPLGHGAILYTNTETMLGGVKAIDFRESILVAENEEFLSIDISQVPPGTYEYIRVSLAYQNYDIAVLANGINIEGTISSFLGYNTYITKHRIKDEEVTVNGNRMQGYWAFEYPLGVLEGQVPPGLITVPNPLAQTSPIPTGSCVVTGKFGVPLIITGQEARSISITLSLSNNKSFEWVEVNADDKFEPLAGEMVVDMGIRGLVPIVSN